MNQMGELFWKKEMKLNQESAHPYGSRFIGSEYVKKRIANREVCYNRGGGEVAERFKALVSKTSIRLV